MPILGQNDMAEALSEPINDGHHGIAVGNRKRAAGAEIVLHVDYQQHIIIAGPDLHSGPVLELISKLSIPRASHRLVRSFAARKRHVILQAASIISQPARWICHLRTTLSDAGRTSAAQIANYFRSAAFRIASVFVSQTASSI